MGTHRNGPSYSSVNNGVNSAHKIYLPIVMFQLTIDVMSDYLQEIH